MHRFGRPPSRGPPSDALALLWFTRAMSPLPRKPKPAKPGKPGNREALERALDLGRKTPAPDVTIRLDAKPPSGAALKRLGIKDARVAELAKHLAGRSEEIAERIAGDRALAELLATDPAAALGQLEVPEELRTGGDGQTRKEFLDRFRGVKIQVPEATAGIHDPVRLTGAQAAAVQLIADTFAAAAANPATFASLKTDPLTVVTGIAANKPPAGLAPGSAAAATVVRDVGDQIAAVYGAPTRLQPPSGTAIRVSRVKGA